MKKIIIRILTSIIILLILVWFGGKIILSFSTANYDGEIKSAHLQSPVEITFDSKGIAQVWAEKNDDLYFALGWLHASERLFQMELVRRYSKGELSELFGDIAFELDYRQRKIGFFRRAKDDLADLTPESLNILNNYCTGINEWIEYKSIMPPEFVVLGLTPENWKPEDCLTIMYYQTWFAHELMDRDPYYNTISEKLGNEIKELFGKYLDWSPPTLHDSFIQKLFGASNPLQMTTASNSWAVSPNKSETGGALHASDPHLAINAFPGFWYIAGLHSKENYNVVGISTPGIPFIAMGHTDSIAYSFTVASVDLIDYYSEKKNPKDSLQVLTSAGYKNLFISEDKIVVKGEDQPRSVPIYYSDNGPVVESDSNTYTTLKWAGFDFSAGVSFNNAIKIHSSSNFEDFRRAVANIGALDVNWIYSDVKGNIGYQLGSPIPVREFENSFVKLPAEDPLFQWKGYRDFNERPFCLNPGEGWLASCNNQVVSDDWPYKIPGFFSPYRMNRISALLDSREKFTIDDFDKFQLDRISGSALQWKSIMKSGAEKIGANQLAEQIAEWDGSMAEDSYSAALFALWEDFITKEIFEDEIGADWKKAKFIMKQFLTSPIQTLIDDKRTPGKIETLNDISGRAVEDALNTANGKNYGEISQLIISHPLSQVKILDFYFNLNRGPFPNGGSDGTLNSNFNVYDSTSGMFNSFVGPSMRFLLDWKNIDGFTINTNTGQSGNPFSEHYDDFVDFMRKGERWNVPFSREIVFQKSESVLRLLPVK